VLPECLNEVFLSMTDFVDPVRLVIDVIVVKDVPNPGNRIIQLIVVQCNHEILLTCAEENVTVGIA
jgi:hypothetical protein